MASILTSLTRAMGRAVNRVLRVLGVRLVRVEDVVTHQVREPLTVSTGGSRTVNISSAMVSELFWQRVVADNDIWLAAHPALRERLHGLERLPEVAQNQTGSISSGSAWLLYCMARYFSPACIAEVGTYIGRSTVSLATGLVDSGRKGAVIHTCDNSNDIRIPAVDGVEIRQYPLQSSVTMLQQLPKGSVDLVHLDGRIGAAEIPLLEQVLQPEGIVVFDDFEGIEKGVANLFEISRSESGTFQRHVLIYPPSRSVMESLGLRGNAASGVLFPATRIFLTNQ